MDKPEVALRKKALLEKARICSRDLTSAYYVGGHSDEHRFREAYALASKLGEKLSEIGLTEEATALLLAAEAAEKRHEKFVLRRRPEHLGELD